MAALSTTESRRPDQPRLPDGKKRRQVHAWPSPEAREMLEKMAAEKDMTLSGVVTQIIHDALGIQ